MKLREQREKLARSLGRLYWVVFSLILVNKTLSRDRALVNG